MSDLSDVERGGETVRDLSDVEEGGETVSDLSDVEESGETVSDLSDDEQVFVHGESVEDGQVNPSLPGVCARGAGGGRPSDPLPARCLCTGSRWRTAK